VTFNPVDVADNLKKYGGYVPAPAAARRRPGYIDSVLTPQSRRRRHLHFGVSVLPAS